MIVVIGLLLLWALITFVVGYEILALLRKEEDWPTWSRWVWAIQRRWPWTREAFLAITILSGVLWTGWLSIHFYFGECAFGIC